MLGFWNAGIKGQEVDPAEKSGISASLQEDEKLRKLEKK